MRPNNTVGAEFDVEVFYGGDCIHGRLRNGNLSEMVEVFRRLYSAVVFGPSVLLSRTPGLSHLLDLAYRVFANNRLRLTGRCSVDGCSLEGAASPQRAG